MSEKEFNVIFSNRLKYFLNKNNMTQVELAKLLGVGPTSVSNWYNGLKTPRMDKIDAMCRIFNCKRSDLMEEAKHEGLPKICDLYPLCHDSDAYDLVSSFLKLDTEDKTTIIEMIGILLKKDKYREKEAICG